MSKQVKPTAEQIKLARFLANEDDDPDSPLYNDIWRYQKRNDCPYYVHDILDQIMKGDTYISDASNTLNTMVKRLDILHANYITDNWKDGH